MPRPKKNPEDRKSYHLRVPLTDAQRELVEQACKIEDQDLAGWARSLLLDAAKRSIRKAGKTSADSP
jgi:uncharacterized protein (DUF1778 family)